MKTKLLALFFLVSFFSQAQNLGDNDPTFNPADKGFGLGDGADGSVKVTTIQSDGKIIIGGLFSTYNGSAREGIARLNTDRTLDETFKVGSGANSGSSFYNNDTILKPRKFIRVPQWSNIGLGFNGFYISFGNTNIRSIFHSFKEYGHSRGFYAGIYASSSLIQTDIGARVTYFFRNLEDKFNFYAKGELAIYNYKTKDGEEMYRYCLPRVGAGIRWRFLYAEAGLGPVPVHAGICWQWSADRE
jgi:predicted lipase